MIATESYLLTLCEAALRISAGELSPVDLVKSCIDAIDRLEPKLKAWVTINYDGAMAEAELCAEEARAGRLRGPLHGIPIGIKDIFYTAGVRTTAGHAPMANFVPDYDAAVVERLRCAGAIILGKTTTTEFALMAPTPTRNPWNLAHTPGGSSSGSGAAVAARMCPAAIGSQTGGSTLRPAAYCGVVGFKPTYGRVSAFGMIPLAYSTDHPGIIARSVDDLPLLLQALAGFDERDHTSARVPVDDYIGGIRRTIAAPRIALLRGAYYDETADDQVASNVMSVARRLRNAGARVEQISLPAVFGNVERAFWKILAAEPAAYHREALENRPETFDPRTLEFLRKGLAMSATKYLEALRVQRELRREVSILLKNFDALLTPATPAPAPEGLESTGDPVFNNPWSMTGHPVVGLPSGLSQEGLPIAIQLIGAAFAEAPLLAFARWCEGVIGFDQSPALGN